jgi:hypothetical protein
MVAQGNSARATSRPIQALKAFYFGEQRPKSGTPVQGRGIAGSMVRTACLVDPQSNKCWLKPGRLLWGNHVTLAVSRSLPVFTPSGHVAAPQ